MERIICLVIGYLFGNIFQTGYWYGKFNHIDIREYGSGNAGTTNVMRTLGKKAGIITYLLDTFKAVFAALAVHFLFGRNSDIEMLLFLYSGFGVVLGHNFPVERELRQLREWRFPCCCFRSTAGYLRYSD